MEQAAHKAPNDQWKRRGDQRSWPREQTHSNCIKKFKVSKQQCLKCGGLPKAPGNGRTATLGQQPVL
eukprot:9928575-Karenia_brevis.AAC.1